MQQIDPQFLSYIRKGGWKKEGDMARVIKRLLNHIAWLEGKLGLKRNKVFFEWVGGKRKDSMANLLPCIHGPFGDLPFPHSSDLCFFLCIEASSARYEQEAFCEE